nr:hypothetical protein [Tanacetum cinerariifolium]
MYDSWRSRMEMYMLNRQHGRIILESVEHGPLLWPSVTEEGVTRLKKYSELSAAEAIQADCDVKATNIILQELPPEIYALERECKLYVAFDKFAYQKGETLCDFYLRFSLLLNEMNMYNMKLEQFQVNMKFLNTLPPKWSKFVTDVKLVRDLHTTNVDPLHAYLGQHEYHANEQQASTYQSSPYTTSYHTPQFVSQGSSSSNLSNSYPMNDTSSTINHNAYMASAPQIDYAPIAHHPSEFSSPKTRLVVPVFQKGDDPIDAINHMMSFFTAVVTSRQRVIVGYNCKGKGHMAKQCTKPKRKRDAEWFKDKKEESRNIDKELALEKQQKFHLAYFDMVVKERTTATAITEGTWGFEYTKACFRGNIIPFVQSLKELFTSFDQWLIDEVTEVQNVFTQMELAVEQHREEKTKRDTWSSQESAPTFAELFEINNLKAQAQAKDTLILKLKEKLNSLNGDVKDTNFNRDVQEIKNLNIKLDHKVTKLAAKNEHLKQTYKQLYDSIKSLLVQSKEQCDDLINKVNLKSAEVSDLNASLQEKVLVITALKEQLNKLKGKVVLTEAVSLNPIDPELLKVDVTPLVSLCLNKARGRNTKEQNQTD